MLTPTQNEYIVKIKIVMT